MMGFGWGYGWLGIIMMGVFWLVVIVVAAWLIRSAIQSNQGRPDEHNPSAREILDSRYARGEITREQYEQMKEDLRP